jgi:Lon protease-like protein
MGGCDAAQALDRAVRLTAVAGTRISIFPLSGAVLYPGLQMPLHIFEPRYRALVGDALVRDRLIGMIQPMQPAEGAPLYSVGCLGKIGEVEAMEDGRYNILLEGLSRFRVLREMAQGYRVDWEQVTRLDDAALINGVSQIAPFDTAARQALLEADSLSARCELLVQLMQFFGKRGDDDGEAATLQ